MESDANLNDEELSEDEEEMEPKLRYERILNDMPEILRTDAASCIAVHPKFLALGMHSGAIHILDHQGNVSKELRLHSLTVHQISIDEKGDHFASCSSDGKVVLHGLYSRDNNQQLTFDRAVGAVAIDPNFYRSGTGRRFITGNDKVSLYEKSFLSRYKVTILHQGEGLTRNITWKGRFAAWASTAQLPVDAVVERLRERPQLLYHYLDALFDKSPSLCQQHHLDLAELYAEFAPKKLLPLLRASNSYHLEKALALCRRKKLVPEVVFLLKHMGNSKEALEQIMGQLGDVHEAIAFCKEQDDRGLWQDLIAHSLDKPAFITTLLHKIGTHVDPILLIHRIPEQLAIPQLRDSLVKIMRDYKLQISLRDGCKKILVSDCIGLLHKLHRQQSRGISLTHDQLCPACNRRLLFKDVRYVEDVVVFFCKHAFHGTCLPTSGPPACSLCSVKKQVRGFGT